jgi:hypothetical protein
MFPKSRLSTPIPGGGALLRAGAIAAILAGLVASPTAAQTVTEKAERDETAIVAKSDPVMAAAMRKAQAELPSFLALSAAPKPGMEGFAVKVAIREAEEASISGSCLLPPTADNFRAPSTTRRGRSIR